MWWFSFVKKKFKAKINAESKKLINLIASDRIFANEQQTKEKKKYNKFDEIDSIEWHSVISFCSSFKLNLVADIIWIFTYQSIRIEFSCAFYRLNYFLCCVFCSMIFNFSIGLIEKCQTGASLYSDLIFFISFPNDGHKNV